MANGKWLKSSEWLDSGLHALTLLTKVYHFLTQLPHCLGLKRRSRALTWSMEMYDYHVTASSAKQLLRCMHAHG